MNASYDKSATHAGDRGRNFAVGVLAAVLCWGQILPAWATPAQVPLLTRTQTSVQPNVVFTFDDSGSMAWRYMPDAIAPVSGNARWWVTFHPDDDSTFGTTASVSPTGARLFATRPNARANGTICTTDTQFSDCMASDRESARMRSSAYNTVYYNPEIRYRPWYNSDGSQFPNADIRAAWLDPNDRPAVGTAAQRTSAVTGGKAVRLIAEDGAGVLSVPSGTIWCRSADGNTPNTTPSTQRNNATTCGTVPDVNFTLTEACAASNPSGSISGTGSSAVCRITTSVTSTTCQSTAAGTGFGGSWSSSSGGRCDVQLNATWCNNKVVGGTWVNSACQRSAEEFVPAVYYTYNGSGTGEARNFKRVRIMDLPATGIVRGGGRTDCAQSGEGHSCSRDQEYQNFANWFTYYRTRNYLAIAASSKAFSEQSDDIRVGYGRINKASTSIDNVATATLQRGVRTFAGTDRTDFFSWLHAVPASGGTPLRRAMDDIGKYYQRADNRGPWGNTPGTDDGVATTSHLQCRKSYHILTTDGYWNGDAAAQATGNVDNTNGPNITGPTGNSFQYSPSRPYLDSHSGTLADVAMYYWNRDLRPNLPNRVPPDSKNPAFWQHMVNFTVGLGVNGTLNYPTALAGLQSGSLNWPAPGNDKQENIDDLWHAAVNSRGEYLSAKDPDEFANSLSSILQEIIVRNASEGGVAAAASTLQQGNRKYVPEYRTAVWSGDVKAYLLNAFGDQIGDGFIWSAEAALPAHGARNIVVGTRNGTPKAETFKWANMSATLRTEMGSGANEALVNFLRGDDTFEGGAFRDRSAKLGDFVNSQPVFVKGLVDLQYNFLPSGTPGQGSYRSFLTTKKNRDGVLFIGGNDGMLHAFRDLDGQEVFGFVPRVLLPALSALASPSYGHRYYVDGQLTESDAYWGGSWKNVLVGSTGAGARALFALDVTSTSAFGAGNVLWELDSTIDADLGYVLAPIEVGLMKNGQWAAVFGNGPYSGSGGKLFVVNLQTGAVIRKISVPGGNGNGLGGARVIRDANRVIVGAYAGDLEGNVWKFDLSSSAPASWGVAFSGSPLYAAGAGKPFTAAPQYIAHPEGGFMVLAGSGKLYDEGDQADATSQSIYGLWDQQKLEQDGDNWVWSSDATPITNAGTIVAQSIDVTTVSGAGDSTYYTISTEELDWSVHRGWRMPLTINSGQRLLLSPQFIFGFALFETMAPSDTGVLNPCDNSSTGAAYNLLLNPLNGAMPGTAVFDTDGDGVVNPEEGGDTVVGGVKGVWDGRDVVLTQQACVTAEACPVSNRCPGGTKLVSIQGAISGNTNICLPVPPPQRWWWRELQQQ